MAITVKHLKVSAIPDSGDDTLIEPSDWNADHQLVGTVPVANGGTGAATLTGYVKGNGTSAMTAASTIPNTDITGLGTASTKDAGSANGVATLDAGGKVPVSELPAAVLGALSYQGTWNASTNTPTLASGVGTKGYYYVVSVAGSTDLDGITDWVVGDWAVYNGTAWQQIDNTDAVTSVNGQTGAVVLTTTNIAEGTNEYFTQARARASISAGTGISYDNSTGVVTNSAPDQVVALTGAGTTSISGTYPNFTITSNDEFDGDVVGPASATDNAIARYDTTTGKLIQNSVVTISDAGQIAGATSIFNTNYVDFDTTYATTLTEGQLGWNSGIGTSTVTTMGGFTGVNLVKTDDTIQRAANTQFISTSTSGTQCVRLQWSAPTRDHSAAFRDFFRVKNSITGSLLDIDMNIDDFFFQNAESTGVEMISDSWHTLCITWNCTTDLHSFSVMNSYESATLDDYPYTCTNFDQIQIQVGDDYDLDHIYSYFDTIDSSISTEYDPTEISGKVGFDFPHQDGEYSNSEWNDWSLWYDLSAGDIGTIGNLVLVVSQDEFNRTFSDYEFISTTTDLTAWILNRGNDFVDGDVYSKAKILKINSSADCITGYEVDCVAVTVAETDVLHWISSTTGYTVFNNPYDKPAGFTPASTTAEDEENAGIIDGLLEKLFNIFPLSVLNDIYDLFMSFKRNPDVEPMILSMQDLMPDEADTILGATPIVILSAAMLTANLPQWDTVVFPFMEYTVYLIGFFFLVFLLWPKARSIDLGGHQPAIKEGQAGQIDLRKPAGEMTIDLRSGYKATPIKKGWFGGFK